MNKLHSLLQQQIERLIPARILSSDNLKSELLPFFQAISEVYQEMDRKGLVKRDAELQALFRITQVLQDRDLTLSACAMVCNEIAAGTGFPMVHLQVYQHELRSFGTIAVHGAGKSGRDLRSLVIPLNEHFLGKDSLEFVSGDLAKDTSLGQIYSRLNMKSFLSVPVRKGSLLLGAITVAHPEAGRQSASVLSWLKSVAAQIALEMERRNIVDLSEQHKAAMIAASKMSELGRMAGGIAHEINTPLATILLLTGMVKEGVLAAELPALANTCDKIESTVMRVSTIVKGLRTFSRDGSGDPFVVGDLRQIAEETLALCGERFAHADIDLKLEASGDVRVHCRETQISQLLLNLLNNAFDAVKDLPERWVRVCIREDGNFTELFVTDSGPGIPFEVRQNLGKPFYTTKTLGSGTGLGLSICYGIVKDHGGSLEVDGKCRNTRFVLRLPRSGVCKAG